MSKKEIGILVLVAVLVVAGILAYAYRGKDADQQGLPPDTSAPSLDASKNASAPADTATTSTTNKTPVKTMEPQTTTTASGLKITILKEGAGEAAKNGDTVSVNYTGMLENGTVFDSNVDPKFHHVEPFAFPLGQGMVIQGWDQGVLGMKIGEHRRLVIPAELGYGARGAGALIPPNATLVFDVEVTGISH